MKITRQVDQGEFWAVEKSSGHLSVGVKMINQSRDVVMAKNRFHVVPSTGSLELWWPIQRANLNDNKIEDVKKAYLNILHIEQCDELSTIKTIT
uniref:Uncharacterized protein n=1 Tax=Romanomermis culicivorax TaxID=13658 RepID=A0A915J861_ROMCU